MEALPIIKKKSLEKKESSSFEKLIEKEKDET